jgi:hypothetical protein
LEVRTEDAERAMFIMMEDYRKSTALDSHGLVTNEAVFDEQASRTVCPACGCIFTPRVRICPECGLSFGE